MNWFDEFGRSENSVSLDNRALHYADGFFTTLRAFDGKCQLLSYHLARLEKCATALLVHIDLHAIQTQLEHHAAQIKFGVIKVHVSRKPSGSRGYVGRSDQVIVRFGCMQKPSDNIDSLVVQEAAQVGILRTPLGYTMPSLAGLKTCARLEQVLLANELYELQSTHDLNIAEALVFSMDGEVCEGVASNFYCMLDGQWYTPAIHVRAGFASGVSGTYRQAILEHSDTVEMQLSASEIGNIEAAFFTNAVKGVMPVTGFLLSKKTQIATPSYFPTAAIENLNLDADKVHEFVQKLRQNAGFMAQL